MNTRDLQYLVALSDHRHFGKAANACFVSQPALSMQIKKLEESLGVKLLERTNKSVLLTDIGYAIAERARIILQHVDELHQASKAAKDLYSGELKMGIIPTLAPYLLPLIMSHLASLFPKLSFYLIEEQTALLLEKLKLGKLDVAFFAYPMQTEKNFTTEFLFDEEFLLAVPQQHPLAKRKSIKQEDLQDKNLLLLEEGHCLREHALSVCQHVNASETQNFRATSLETLRHMVAAGIGITLIPKLAQKPNDGICYIPFTTPIPTRTIGLSWRTSSAKKLLFEDMVRQLKNIPLCLT